MVILAGQCCGNLYISSIAKYDSKSNRNLQILNDFILGCGDLAVYLLHLSLVISLKKEELYTYITT